MDIVSYVLAKEYTDQRMQEQQLKTAQVEQELKAYKETMAQININQEAKQQVSGYGVVGLPKNAAEGQISVTVKGETLTSYIDEIKLPTEDIVLHRTNRRTYNIANPFKMIPGQIYTIFINVKNVSSEGIFRLNYKAYSPDVMWILNKGINKRVITAGSDTTLNQLYFYIMLDAGENETAVLDPTILVLEGDWTNKPTPPFFRGTKSTLCAGRFRAVGKNLFDPHKFVETVRKFSPSSKFTILDGEEVIELQPGGLTDPQRRLIEGIFKPNTQYTISFKGKKISSDTSVRFRIFYTDGSFTDGAAITNQTNFTTRTAVSAAEKTIDFIGIQSGYPGGIYMKEIQLEEGAAATAYEPYRENNAYVIAKDPQTGEILEARSLPNGVKDEFNVVEGKYTKKVSDTVSVSGTMFASLDTTTYVNVDVVKTTAFSDAMAGTTGKDGMTRLYDKNGVELTEVAQTDIDNTASIGKYYWHTDKTLWLIVAKGAYADISAARTALGTMTLIYQLATPLEIPIQVSGTLVSYPSGTVYVEPFVADAGLYNNGITVLHQDLPIKSIEKISKIDYETGIEYELDKSKVVINTDKLSLTHPDLQNGDIVFFIYEYDKESTIPEIEVEFYDSRYVVKDSATGKFYKWSITVTNGTPSIQLTEV